ncbi:hypothetical protein D7D52_27485 [Nocardia yunnanensis]|uniref:Uncharacterized protein n=1 Tax=Nocardia yunnanensis TaxID=2382165 RepID=A0A386ZH86_9NOCA|nr:hypothetical protein [Nocardia yunnanensis]AYF76928.1 hypothetical protein D7D52_27485 [Nocardia yunnanensis]
MRRPDPALLRAGWRLIRVPLLLAVAYLILRTALESLSARHGFGSPEGLGLGYLAAAVLVAGLRLILVVVVPVVAVYRVTTALIMVLLRRYRRT